LAFGFNVSTGVRLLKCISTLSAARWRALGGSNASETNLVFITHMYWNTTAILSSGAEIFELIEIEIYDSIECLCLMTGGGTAI
jgi:hypothetical protein